MLTVGSIQRITQTLLAICKKGNVKNRNKIIESSFLFYHLLGKSQNLAKSVQRPLLSDKFIAVLACFERKITMSIMCCFKLKPESIIFSEKQNNHS